MGKGGEMTRFLLTLSVLWTAFSLAAETMRIGGVDFACRAPAHYDADSRILVLFGGRNWPGEKTLKTFGFDRFADRRQLFLLSPSFVNRDYWEPQKWSGSLLKKAVAELEKRYRLHPRKLYFYGYSAGGQCSNLFYAWMPDRVAAWGAHACGVYFTGNIPHPAAPALITCGVQDAERLVISRQFLYRYRESGGELLWKTYPGGHELNPAALELARAWLDAVLSGAKARKFGEDDSMLIRKRIDTEFRNPLYTPQIEALWRK